MQLKNPTMRSGCPSQCFTCHGQPKVRYQDPSFPSLSSLYLSHCASLSALCVSFCVFVFLSVFLTWLIFIIFDNLSFKHSKSCIFNLHLGPVTDCISNIEDLSFAQLSVRPAMIAKKSWAKWKQRGLSPWGGAWDNWKGYCNGLELSLQVNFGN